MEKYSRGRRGAPAKGVGRATGARVQIPLSPLTKYLSKRYFFLISNLSENMFKTLKKNSKIICYVLAFFIPVIFMLIVSVAMEFTPFSWRIPLVGDIYAQFYPYYSYLKSVIFSNNDLLYTFSKTLGGDMAGFSFYYLANPLVYLLAFVPSNYMPAGLLIILIIMIAFSSLNFNIMVNNMCGFRWSSLLFSVSYAFIGFLSAYLGVFIFFYNIMLFPIVILGLYEIAIKEKISLKYTVFLAASVITNYYIGYMTCIFTCLFFIYLLIVNKKEVIVIKKHFKVIGIFIWQTLLALLISSVALFTVAYSLSNGQKVQEGFFIKIFGGTNFRLPDVFSNFYSISFNGNISDGLPIIYCGTLAVVFLILYFLNKEISLKEKISSAVLLLILILSFYIKFINRIWHGMADPVGFPYRYSFFFSFFVLLISYRAFINLKQGTRKYHTLIVFGIFVFYSLYMLISKNAYVSINQIILTGTFLCMYLAGIYAICYKREYMYPVTIGFFLILSFDLLLNTHYSICKYYDLSDTKASVEYIDDYYKNLKNIYENTVSDNNGDEFYRFDKTYRLTNNDAMLVGYDGLSHFSSTESSEILDFMKDLGFCSNNMWSYYGEEGNTAFIDSFLSLKYMASQFDETGKPYDYMTSIDEKYLFKNPYSLGLAINCDENIRNIDREEFNHFTLQNEIAKCITGEPYGIYRPVEVVNINLYNVEKYEKTYTVIDPNKESYIEYELNVDSDDFIYMYFDAPEKQNTKLFVNGLEKPEYFTNYGWSIKCTGYFDNGIVPVRIYLNQPEIEIDGYEFYYESKEELERFYNDVNVKNTNTRKISSSKLFINSYVDEGREVILLTMPFDEGWIVKVDGEEVETKQALGCLLSFDVKPGNHIIEMKYIPRGLVIGSILSIIGIVILITIYIIERRRIKKLLNVE